MNHPLFILIIMAAILGGGPVVTLSATGNRGYTGTQLFDTEAGDKDPGEPKHCGEAGGASSWFFYRAPRSGVLVFDTKGSSFDTVLAVYIGPGTDFASLTNVTCNNDSSPSNTWSKVVFEAIAGTLYYVAIDGVGGASGTVQLNYQIGDPLVLTQQPTSLDRVVGSSASFNAAASGQGPIAFQWMFNNVPMNTATQAALNLAPVQLSNEGVYSVRVEDALSVVQSTNAYLAVYPTVPNTNSLFSSQITLDGVPRWRVAGCAAVGSVLEVSENLIQWFPGKTNLSSQGLFILDDFLNQPQRYFRLRLRP